MTMLEAGLRDPHLLPDAALSLLLIVLERLQSAFQRVLQ
jgi:hypothetical protein